MPRRGDGESSEQLRIWLLGGFRVALGAREVDPAQWRLRKARSLVKLLALAPGHRLHREQLLEVLWPDLEPEPASNNLRKALHIARRALISAGAAPLTPYLQLKDDVLILAPDGGLWVDVEAFELAAAEARRRRDVEAYRVALDLHSSDLLPEDRYEDWTISRREALRQEYLSLLAELAAIYERAGAFAPAAEVLLTLLTHDPGREEAHRSLMRLYALTGRRQQALRQYQMLKEAAGREFDAEPDAQSQRLYQEIASGRFPPPGTGEAPPAPASAGPAPTLPAGTVTFLFTDIEGSTQLLAELGDRYADILAAHHRLLRAAFGRWGGQEVDTQGDAFFVAFPRAKGALSAALAAQRAVMAHGWPDGISVRVRMGLHTGEPLSAETGYVGIDVHRAARICATAHGGQILTSGATRELVEDDLPEGLSLRDLGEHRLRDLARPQRLFQVVAPGLQIDFPPPRSLDSLPNNLPIQLTSFVGREHEIAEVSERLTTIRQLTLTGSGGVGKTRLALEVAVRVLGNFPEGVWLVDLSAIVDPVLVPRAVASVLNVQEDAGRSLIALLGDYLRNKRALLVLDNCEHLATECAQLAENLLGHCRGVRVLATSRETLGMAGEAVYRVPSLSQPDRRRLPAFDDLIRYEAVRLFADRAALSQPGFVLTQDNAATVAQICGQLDGIPLAIELAAARVRALSIDAIASRLGDRFRLLTGGTRTALPRQQTLRAVMDWSYDLLTEPERVFLRRLSVFAGGFSLEAAQAVGMPAGVDEVEVVDLLTRLVDKSLVTVDPQGADVRYRLLDTVRQYSREKLVDAGDAGAVQRRHRDFFLTLAEQAEPELHKATQMIWLDRLEAEHDNLRAALEWSLGQVGDDSGLRLASALAPYWHARGYLTEGREWLERARAQDGDVTQSLRMKILVAAARLAFAQDDFASTKMLLEGAVPLLRAAGDLQALALSLAWLGHATWHQGERARGVALCEESLALARTLEDPWIAAVVYVEVATVAVHEGDRDRARPLLEDSVERFRTVGDTAGIAYCLYQLGSLALTLADYWRAAALIEESLTLQRRLKRKPSVAASLGRLGRIALLQGHYDRAVALLEDGVALAEELGKKEDTAIRKVGTGLAALAQGDFERAARLFEESLALRTEFGSKFDTFDPITALGILARYRGDDDQARRLLEERVVLFRQFRGTTDLTDPLYHLGMVVLSQGDTEQAAALLRESLEQRRARQNTRGIAECLEGLARVALISGQADRAARLFAAAEALREAISAPRWPVDKTHYERDLQNVKTSLGEGVFAAAWTGGRAMAIEEAVTFALTPS